MKGKILMILLFFLFMAAVPVGFSAFRTEKTPAAPPQNRQSADAVARTALMCGEDFSDEAIRAAAIIQRTNLLCGGETDTADNISDTELYKRVERIYGADDSILTFNGKAVYIPHADCSNGYTSSSDAYPYLCAAASPWDCCCAQYDSALRCEGVSVNGLRVLTDSGQSAEEALLWYLPRLQIRKAKSI